MVSAPCSTIAEIVELIAHTGRSRIPLYRDGAKDLVGTVHASMLPGLDPDAIVETIMDPPFVIPEVRFVEGTFRDLRVHGRHMGILVDEHGVVSGIVTLKNIVEEIVGEIEEEER